MGSVDGIQARCGCRLPFFLLYSWSKKGIPSELTNSAYIVLPLNKGLAASISNLALIAFAIGNVIRPNSVRGEVTLNVNPEGMFMASSNKSVV